MLKPFLIGAVAASGIAASPALADNGRWDRDYRGDRYERDYRDSRRYARAEQAAYRDGLTDGRRGYRNDKHDYRSRDLRRAYQEGFADGRRQYAESRRYDDYRDRRDYRDIRYNRGQDYRGDWYGRNDRRYDSYERCRADNGVNTGTVAGGALGGVLGNEIARRGDKVAGTIIGAAVGAVIGHEVGKGGDSRRYCY